MTALHSWTAELPVAYSLIYVGADAGTNPAASGGPLGTELVWGDEQTLVLRANSDNARVTVEYFDSEPEPRPDAEMAYLGRMTLSGWLPVSSPTMANEMVSWQLPAGPSWVRVEVAGEQWWVSFWRSRGLDESAATSPRAVLERQRSSLETPRSSRTSATPMTPVPEGVDDQAHARHRAF